MQSNLADTEKARYDYQVENNRINKYNADLEEDIFKQKDMHKQYLKQVK